MITRGFLYNQLSVTLNSIAGYSVVVVECLYIWDKSRISVYVASGSKSGIAVETIEFQHPFGAAAAVSERARTRFHFPPPPPQQTLCGRLNYSVVMGCCCCCCRKGLLFVVISMALTKKRRRCGNAA